MATHDYVIDNQSAPAFRADLNDALQAIVTQNSSASAPPVTYANMLWYDTVNNQLKKRNEANSNWIILGTIDETLGTFTPSGTPAIASQSEAETGTDNTKMMTPLRTSQAIAALGSSFTLLGTINTTSGASQTLSGLNLTGYELLMFFASDVTSTGTSGTVSLRIGGISVNTGIAGGFRGNGDYFIDLATGCVGRGDSISGSANTGYSTATTSVTVSCSGTGTFTGGSIRVYGVK